MKIESSDIPMDAVRAYHENVKAQITPTIEEGIAYILSQRQVQRMMIERLMESLTDKEIHDLFRGYRDRFDIDFDRVELRDLLLNKIEER